MLQRRSSDFEGLMKTIASGVQHFEREGYRVHQDLFRKLRAGQAVTPQRSD